MGGRAAEEVVFDTYTTGAENDMQQATDLARQMVTRWGMSARLGPVTLAPRDGSSGNGLESFGFGGGKPYGMATGDAIDAEVQRLFEEAASEANRLLRTHRRELDALAAALVEQETMDEAAIRRVTGLSVIPRTAPVPLRRPGATSLAR
jgi:cell division protease FtsH